MTLGRNNIKGWGVLLWISVLFYSHIAQGQHLFTRAFGIQDGLSCIEITDVIQSESRYLWLATCDGVMRFDGEEFVPFYANDNQSEFAKRLFEDSRGRIWVARWNAPVFYIKNDKTHFLTGSARKYSLNVGGFVETPDSVIWIIGHNSILKYKDDSLFVVYESVGDTGYALGNNAMLASDGKIWIPTLGRGIGILDTKTETIKMITSATHGINNICYSVTKDDSGTIWIGSYGTVYKYSPPNFIPYVIEKGGSPNRVWSFLDLGTRNFGLALYGNGIGYLDIKTGKTTCIDTKHGLKDRYLYKMIRDIEGNTWIVSQSGGLEKFFGILIERYSMQEGMPSANIMDIAFQADSSVLVATQGGLVRIKNGAVKKIWRKGTYMNSVEVMPDGRIWFAGSKFHGSLENPTLNPPDDLYLDFCYDSISQTFTYVGFRSICEYVGSHQKRTKYWALNSRFVFRAGEDIFILRSQGVSVIRDDSLEWFSLLGKAKYHTYTKLTEKMVLLGSSTDVVLLWKRDGKWETRIYPLQFFELQDNLKAIEKEGNQLWMVTNRNLVSVDLRNMIYDSVAVITQYNRFKEVIKGQVNEDVLKINHKIVYVGTSEGLLVFKPGFSQISEVRPILKLSVFEIYSNSRFIAQGDNDSQLFFPYKNNHLLFEMKAISLSLPENTDFRYRLQGIDKEWSKITKDSKVSYAHLPPGDYTFEFLADNGLGVWADEPVRWTFTILPPFWQTKSFYGLLGAVIVLIVAGLVYYREHKAYLLAQQQQQFTKAIWAGQEDERKRIAKELHDGLGQNMLALKNAMVSGIDKDRYLDMLDVNIEAIRSLSRILHPFVLEKFGLSKAIEAIADTMNEIQEEIFFSTDVDNVDGVLNGEMELNLYRVIQEAVSNILKHSQATAAKICLKNRSRRLVITIRDNGKGFAIGNKLDVLNSFGLKSMSERIKLMQGQVSFARDNGTYITIIIPVT